MNKSKESLLSDDLSDFKRFVDNKYDAIIVGSDEVWKTDGFRGFPTAYWLWGNLHCLKYAYAVSSRSDFSKLSKDNLAKIKNNLNNFDYISARDDITKDSLEKTLDVNRINNNPDPSFVYDLPIYKNNLYRNKLHIRNNKKNVLVIIDIPNTDELSRKLHFELNKKYNLISVYRYCNGMRNISNLSPLQWATMIKQADIVITNLYHGVCYSMIYNTPYIAIGTEHKKDKILSLVSKDNDLQNRYINGIEELLKLDISKLIIDKLYFFDNSNYIKKSRNDFEDFIIELNKNFNNLSC